jgi:hypothetical protein
MNTIHSFPNHQSYKVLQEVLHFESFSIKNKKNIVWKKIKNLYNYLKNLYFKS